MDAEFNLLEEKIRQTAEMCQRLREENRDLRNQLATLQGEGRKLSEKIESARARIKNLLGQIPE